MKYSKTHKDFHSDSLAQTKFEEEMVKEIKKPFKKTKRYMRKIGKTGGIISAFSRFGNMTKKEISEYMKKVRAGIKDPR